MDADYLSAAKKYFRQIHEFALIWDARYTLPEEAKTPAREQISSSQPRRIRNAPKDNERVRSREHSLTPNPSAKKQPPQEVEEPCPRLELWMKERPTRL